MKRAATILVALLAAILVTTMVATPAQADNFWENCPSGTGCVYVDFDGFGTRYIMSVGNSDVNVCHNLPGALDNKASSTMESYGSYNGHKLDLHLYSTYNCATPAALVWIPPVDFGHWNFETPYSLHNNVHSSYIIGYRD